MRFASFEISSKGFIVGLFILIVPIVLLYVISITNFINGKISGLDISWIVIPITMILAGLSVSYIGKCSKFLNGIITAVILSVIYSIIVFAMQSLLLPTMSGGEMAGIGSAMEVAIPTNIYYLQIVYSFIKALVFLNIGGIIGVYLSNKKTWSKSYTK